MINSFLLPSARTAIEKQNQKKQIYKQGRITTITFTQHAAHAKKSCAAFQIQCGNNFLSFCGVPLLCLKNEDKSGVYNKGSCPFVYWIVWLRYIKFQLRNGWNKKREIYGQKAVCTHSHDLWCGELFYYFHAQYFLPKSQLRQGVGRSQEKGADVDPTTVHNTANNAQDTMAT